MIVKKNLRKYTVDARTTAHLRMSYLFGSTLVIFKDYFQDAQQVRNLVKIFTSKLQRKLKFLNLLPNNWARINLHY